MKRLMLVVIACLIWVIIAVIIACIIWTMIAEGHEIDSRTDCLSSCLIDEEAEVIIDGACLRDCAWANTTTPFPFIEPEDLDRAAIAYDDAYTPLEDTAENYGVVCHKNSLDLVNLVQSYIDKGWQPIGGFVVVENFGICQTISKDNNILGRPTCTLN